MQVTVYGASGKVGQRVVREALRRGHQVIAYVHSSRLASQPNLTIIKGDIYDPAATAAALRGSDAVISALGSWGTQKKNVLSSAMQTIVPALEGQGTKRIVSLTGNIAVAPGDHLNPLLRLIHTVAGLFFKPILVDGEAHIQTLAASQLEWTVVRSPVMTTFGNQQYTLQPHIGIPPTIHRQAVAECLVDLAESHDWARQAPVIRRR